MPRSPKPIVIDDRLLIEALLVGLHPGRAELHTTTYWYYRACRAAVAGAGGHLSGPFEGLGAPEQQGAIAALLELPPDIGLPDPRVTVPTMVEVANRHPRLNLLNLEAVAVGLLLAATLWLSPESARGVLPTVLDDEGVTWRTITIN